jgi:predicted nucleic acid-binding protein
VIDETLSNLDPGEQAAITLAQMLPADLLIIDERLGRQTANDRGIPIIGTLGILDNAATQGLIDLAETIAQLQKTNFRVSRRIIQALLQERTQG